MNNTAKKRFKVGRTSVGTGTTSLLMIFTILCFATLAMLSLSTADSYRSLQQTGTENTQQIAQAKGQAAQTLAELDAQLAELQRQYSQDAQPYQDAATQKAQQLGWIVDDEMGTVYYVTDMPDENELVTELEINELSAELRYTLVRQITRLSGGWAPEEAGQLFPG